LPTGGRRLSAGRAWRIAFRLLGRGYPLLQPSEEDPMAKTDKKLYDRLRDRGVRKGVARKVSSAVGDAGSKTPKAARRAVGDLTAAAAEIKDRMEGGPKKRSEAAQKAAKTRKKKAAKRSEAAKKGAKKRKAKS
jgi:hypothetical protein